MAKVRRLLISSVIDNVLPLPYVFVFRRSGSVFSPFQAVRPVSHECLGNVHGLVAAALKVRAHVRKDDAAERVAGRSHQPADVVRNEALLHIVDLLFLRLRLLQQFEAFLFEDLHRAVQVVDHRVGERLQFRHGSLRKDRLRRFHLRREFNDVLRMVADPLEV